MKKLLCIILSLAICAGFPACGRGYAQYVLTPNTEAADDTGDEQEYNDTVQLTEADIQAMNDGDALVIYGDEGYVTTLVGRYYNDKIADFEHAITSLNGVASLIGLNYGSEFFCVFGETDSNGYTYYTFQQRYGGLTLQYATLRVVVDPEGYAAGLSSSFVPDVGIAEEQDSISASEAEAVVRSHCGTGLTYYTDYTTALAVNYNNITVRGYAVYTSNLTVSDGFDMVYLQHFVTFAGEYLTCTPTNSLEASTENVYKTDAYFDELTAETYTGTVSLYDGTTEEITVPVAYNENDGLYYLADVERKIMVADYYAFNYEGQLRFLTSEDNTGWSDNYLLSYKNYLDAYDFYADMGIRSVDGFETPILVTMGYCDENGEGVDNACFYGINDGWACFAVSDVNTYSQGLDVAGHEYTHGITRYSMGGTYYANETGAINEAYSDIMGNLLEMLTGGTQDETWLMGENCGAVQRCMSDPNLYSQPAFVGDVYYVPPVLTPSSINDNGGVHTNNSLAGHIAYELYEAGMSLEQERLLWFKSIEVMTPYADYDDLYACLCFSARINGLEEYEQTITSLFEDAGLLNNRAEEAHSAEKTGCGRITFQVSEELAAGTNYVQIADAAGQLYCSTTADENGTVSVLLPAGEYGVIFVYVADETQDAYCYGGDGWYYGGGYVLLNVSDGQTLTLEGLS